MTSCSDCMLWITRRATRYDDGTEIDRFVAPTGRGACSILGIETAGDFGCNKYVEGLIHLEIERKTGAPWQHFRMIPCPDCGGKGDGGRGHRCAGTGLVRLYDDGYVGDEQTRMHPKEKEVAAPLRCVTCSNRVDPEWKNCPMCGTKLFKVAETEIVTDALAGLPMPEAGA